VEGVELREGPLRCIIEPTLGGRIASLQFDDTELLITGSASDHPMMWGCYPMVPWAGRVRQGRFRFGGEVFQLDLNMTPHSIHGVGYRSAWEQRHDGSLVLDLATGWPLGGWARQRFRLDRHRLQMQLELHAVDRPMPGMVGWHPWFVRPMAFTFQARSQYLRDDDGIPTRTTSNPVAPPWDDCFTEVTANPVLHYGTVDVVLSSTCDHWVVYDEPIHAVCIEPQSGPPNAFNLAPQVVEPGSPLVHTFTVEIRPTEFDA
jgi:aldose 1-epimerase